MNRIKGKIIEKWRNLGIRFKFVFSVLSLFVIGVVSLWLFFTSRIDTLLVENLKQKLDLIESNFSVIVKNSLLESSYSTLNTLIRRISEQDRELKYIVVMDQSRNILATSDEKKYPVFYRIVDSNVSKKIEDKDENIFFTEDENLIAKLSLIYLGNEGALDLNNIPDELEDLEKLEDLPLEESLDAESDLKPKQGASDGNDKKAEQNAKAKEKPAPQGYLYIVLSTEYVRAEIFLVWLFSVILLFIMLTLGYFIARAIGTGLAQPLSNLAAKVREIATGNLKVLIERLPRRDEIGQLVSDVDEMRLSIKSLTENLEEKVEQRTYQLQKSQNENERILNTMETGLFSIDENYMIGSQYSKITEKIFENDKLANVNFFTVLKKCMDAEQLRVTDKYLNILFNRTIDDAFIADLNLLQNIQIKFSSDLTKYVKFTFYRIYVNEDIIGVMATLDDITEAYLLNQKLEENEKKLDQQMKQLVAILDIDPQSLSMFISDTDQDISEVRQVLKQEKFDESGLEHVYRIVHSIKGNASILNLELISEVAHSGEEEIIKIQKNMKINSESLSTLNNVVSEINNSVTQVKGLIEKLKRFKSSYKEAKDINVLMLESVEKTIERLSKSMEKGVNFEYKNFNTKFLNDKNRKVVKDVLIQLVRNSVNHGIESFKERKEKGKMMEGKVILKSGLYSNGYMGLVFEDDGRGLDPEKLRKKALSMSKFKREDIHSWDDEKIKQIIFYPGFSTQEKASMTAGRGVGMDIIKEEIEKFGGKVKIESEKGKYFRVKIMLPNDLKN